jgi:hypothetical protein
MEEIDKQYAGLKTCYLKTKQAIRKFLRISDEK